jgi:threonine dehydratase
MNAPHAISRTAIGAAAARIAPYVRRTPVLAVPAAELGLGVDMVLKLELLQHAGSFKPRGAFNRILTAQEAGELPASGVIAASGGNHGAAVAYAARALGLVAAMRLKPSHHAAAPCGTGGQHREPGDSAHKLALAAQQAREERLQLQQPLRRRSARGRSGSHDADGLGGRRWGC